MAGIPALEVEEGVDIERRIMQKIDRHLIPWFFSLGICCYLDRTNLAFAAVQLSQELDLSCATYGLGAGLFFVGYSFQVPSTMMLTRFGAPRWLSFTVIMWGLVAMAFSATNGTAMFLSLRVALGLAECGTFPGMWSHLSKFYTARELGVAYTAVTTSTAIAQVIGAPLAALILSLNGFLGLAGWQWLFLVEGMTTLIFGVFLRFFLAPSPAEAACLTVEERQWLQHRQDSQPTSSKDSTFQAQLTAVKEVLKNWKVWYMSALWLTITQSMYGIIFFAPMMIHKMFSTSSIIIVPPPPPLPQEEYFLSSPSYYYPPPPPPLLSSQGKGCGGGENSNSSENSSGAGVALLSMAPFAAAAIAMLINARLSKAANERHRHAGIPIVSGAFFMALTPIALAFIAPFAAFLCLVLAAAFVWAFHGPFMSWPAVFLSGHEASTGFAVINSLGSFGGLIGPVLLGVLADTSSGSYGVAMFVLAGMLCLGGIGILLFPDKGKDVEIVEVVGEEVESGGGGGGKDGERVPILGQEERDHSHAVV